MGTVRPIGSAICLPPSLIAEFIRDPLSTHNCSELLLDFAPTVKDSPLRLLLQHDNYTTTSKPTTIKHRSTTTSKTTATTTVKHRPKTTTAGIPIALAIIKTTVASSSSDEQSKLGCDPDDATSCNDPNERCVPTVDNGSVYECQCIENYTRSTETGICIGVSRALFK
jgi:hypothetical protein